MKLTQETLKEILHYDSETGEFTWKKPPKNKSQLKNKIAGYINFDGYRIIMINGFNYRSSRLACLHVDGFLPEHFMDHKNRIRHDDRWSNLRHVTRSCNNRNLSIRKDNRSGITGICWNRRKNKWHARITYNLKVFHLGYFSYLINAAKARWNAEKRFNFPKCNTTSSAYLYLKECDG